MADTHPVSSPPKYEQIRHYIAAQIADGVLAVGDRLDSEENLAERFGVARGTVRRAISDLERDGQLQAIHGRGTFVRRRGSMPRTRMISFITTDPEHDFYNNDFYFPILRAVEETARTHNVRILFTNFSPEEMLADQEHFLTHVGDASIVVRNLPRSASNLYKTRSIPVVLVGNRSVEDGVDSVVADNYRGAYLATRHLIELGHRRIVHVEHDMKVATGPERRDGYLAALRDEGIETDDSLIVPCDSKNPDQLERDLDRVFARELEFTAIFAASDHRAMLVLDYLRKRDIVVPDSMSVAGFDDLLVAGSAPYGISTISVDKTEMGRAAVELILRRFSEPTSRGTVRIAPVSLVVRSSTAAPRRASADQGPER